MKEPKFDALIIGGFGHIGLPLGIVLAHAGLQIALYDTDDTPRAAIMAGKMPFRDDGAEAILRRVMGRQLHIVSELSTASKADSIIITIGTPLDQYLNPKLMPIFELAENLLPYLQKGHHLVLRSTAYPGTAQRLNDYFAKRRAQTHLSFCPERVVQGQAIRELGKFPQIISGFTEEAVARAEALFSHLGIETIRVSVQEAELTKLFTNAWRYLQFAIANQFYMIATDSGADFNAIHYAMTHNYDRALDFPTPGFAAGPCLLKDTMQLSAFLKNNFVLGHVAMLINEGLPNYLVDRLRTHPRLNLSGSRVGILGMSFKADSDDIRESLSYKLAKILRFDGATVVCSDEFVRGPSFVTKEELIETCSVVIIGVPHSAYRSLRVPQSTLLIDLWNIVQPHGAGTAEE